MIRVLENLGIRLCGNGAYHLVEPLSKAYRQPRIGAVSDTGEITGGAPETRGMSEAAMVLTTRHNPRAKRYWVHVGVCVAALAVCVTGTGLHAEPPDGDARSVWRVTGVTVPSEQATLAAVTAARIAAFPIAEGGTVHAGQVVVALDDSVQLARTNIARAEAESDLRPRLALAKWQLSERSVPPDTHLRTDGGRSSSLTSADIVRLEYELKKFERAQARLRWRYEQQVLREYQIRAPFDGHVDVCLKSAGEAAAAQEDLITLIRVNPLLVRLDCPAALAPFVMTGDRYLVTPLDRNWSTRTGTITHVGRVIDQVSQTFRVELSVDNSDELWRAGLSVSVNLDAPLQDSLGRHTNARNPRVGSR